MRKLLNTLYIMTPETYLALENDNVIVLMDENVMGKFPLHTLEQIIYFGYKGASLNGGMCQKKYRTLFLSPEW